MSSSTETTTTVNYRAKSKSYTTAWYSNKSNVEVLIGRFEWGADDYTIEIRTVTKTITIETITEPSGEQPASPAEEPITSSLSLFLDE